AAGGVLEWGGLLSVSGGWTASNQTWLFSHGVWTNLTSTASATMPWGDAYDSPGLVYDPAVSAAVLIGFSGNEFDTWAFNGTWANESTPSHPPALAYTAVGWDPEINGIRMFGGLSSASTNATWEYSNRLDFQAFPPIASPATVDQGFATTLSAQFQGGTGPWNVSWTLGDGSTAYGADVSHAYATQGAFTVTSVVTDSLGSTLSAATVVTVVSAVSVVASSSLPVTDLGLDPLFTAVASGGTGIATATWDFGDGTVALGASVYHSYHAVGRYSAVVWVNDTGAGSVSALVVTQVNTAPSVNFTFSPSAPVLGELVNFTAAPTGGTPPYALSWAFGDGGTGGNLTAISHVFTTNGPFSAAVTVTDHVGGRATFSSNLTVALNLSIFGSWAAGAAPLPVGFTSLVAGGIPGYTYAWAFGDGATSTEAYPSHTYALPGQYTAQLTVTDAAQHTATAHWALAVFTGGGPLAVTVTAGPSAIAVGGSTALQASPSGGTGGYRLAWLNGPLSCVASGVLSERCTGPAAGSYVVTLQVYDSTGAEQAGSVTIQVGTPSIVSTPPPAHPIGLTTGQWLLIAGAVTTASVVALAVLVARRGRAGGAPPPPSLGRSEGGQPQSGDGRDTEEDTLSDLV
ncbi:MAG TPA: PKD domain-containing protein, partial [Thermoplasmata archaeon]|nr:PKD domain-containing protein [Thermoplasmata archaeon]